MTKTMEVEFTDEQFEKVKAMESKGISVGEAIDMLFRIQKGVIEENSNQLEQKRAEINEKKAAIEAEEAEFNRELENFNKLMDTGLDVEEKRKSLQFSTILLMKKIMKTKLFNPNKKSIDERHIQIITPIIWKWISLAIKI